MTLLKIDETLPDGSLNIDREDVKGVYEFVNVSLQYCTGGQVLRYLALQIHPGETVGIVGATGAGKSSMIKLLMRFYDVNGGRILLDGKDIRKYKMRDVVRAAGLVSQDIFLFHGTVKENIRYGTFDAADEEVEEAAR